MNHSLVDVPIARIGDRQHAINYKAIAHLNDVVYATTAYEVKRSRAVWDPRVMWPNTGRRGAWRCPPGTANGGDFTDRFGRGCGWGVSRRIANAISDAGEHLEDRDELGRRQRRINRDERRDEWRQIREANRMLRAERPGRLERALGRGADRLDRTAPSRAVRGRAPRAPGLVERGLGRAADALDRTNPPRRPRRARAVPDPERPPTPPRRRGAQRRPRGIDPARPTLEPGRTRDGDGAIDPRRPTLEPNRPARPRNARRAATVDRQPKAPARPKRPTERVEPDDKPDAPKAPTPKPPTPEPTPKPKTPTAKPKTPEPTPKPKTPTPKPKTPTPDPTPKPKTPTPEPATPKTPTRGATPNLPEIDTDGQGRVERVRERIVEMVNDDRLVRDALPVAHREDMLKEELEQRRRDVDLLRRQRDNVNNTPVDRHMADAMLRVFEEDVKDLEKRLGNRSASSPSSPPPPSSGTTSRPFRDRLRVLRGFTPRKRLDKRGRIGEEASDGRMIPREIKNSKIKTVDDAVAHVRDGKSLSEVPNEFWLEAIQQNATFDQADNSKRFLQIPTNGGAMGDTRIFSERDADGKPVGQGWVLKGDMIELGVGEVMGAHLARAHGLAVGDAGWDGTNNGEAFVVVPFGANELPDGAEHISVGMTNYVVAVFDDQDDIAMPQRMAHMLHNFALGQGDRHDGNAMTYKDADGNVFIIPIDQAFFGDYEQITLKNYAERAFFMDKDLQTQSRTHLRNLADTDRAAAIAQAQQIVDTYDEVLTRAQAVVQAGKVEFLRTAVSGVLPGQETDVRNQAELMWFHYENKVRVMTGERDQFLRSMIAASLHGDVKF